jgi:hypothetical protein
MAPAENLMAWVDFSRDHDILHNCGLISYDLKKEEHCSS